MINFPVRCHINVFLEFKLFWIFNFLVQITPTAIWECISWKQGFNGKMRRNKNDFILEVSCVKNYRFFTAPRWSEKALFCTIFFSPNIDFDHRSLHLGWFISVFLEFMVKKWTNFQHNDILRIFRIQTFLNILFWIIPTAIWSVFHGSQGSMSKREEIRMIFSGGVMCEKLPFLHSPAVVRKGTFLHNLFFSEYRFWSQVGASGVVYLSFLKI